MYYQAECFGIGNEGFTCNMFYKYFGRFYMLTTTEKKLQWFDTNTSIVRNV